VVTITVCVGSSCFLRGAPAVIEGFQRLIDKEARGKVELKGSFCMEKCGNGVSVMIGDTIYADVTVDDVETVFREHVLPVLAEGGV
jgi:NADH:ubiquinone oxidoreductase subunit E